MESGNMNLANALERRRKALGLSGAEAARRTGVHRLTWRGWEKGASRPDDYNYVKIEQAMQWERGSVDALITGGTPMEMRAPTDDEVLNANVLEATKEDLVRTAALIELVQGADEAERFLARAYAMRDEARSRRIPPGKQAGRDVS